MKQLFKLFCISCLLVSALPTVQAAAISESTPNSVVLYSWIGSQQEVSSYQYNDRFVPVDKETHAMSPAISNTDDTLVDDSKKTDNITAKFLVNEPAVWHIVIGTPTWFTSGTQMPTLDLPNLVTTKRNLSATNLSNTFDGQTWTYQLWTIPIFITASGEYHIPPMQVKAYVSENGASKEVSLWTKDERFIVDLPTPELAKSHNWFAAPNASLSEEWTLSQDDLHVGDSISRTVTLSAENSLAVMLPKLSDNVLSDQYQSYISPSQPQDNDDSASRIEKSVYILQKGGDVTFPAIDIKWWDTNTQSLKTLHVASKTFSVKHTLKSWLQYYLWHIVLFFLVIIVAVLLYNYLKHYYKTHPEPQWYAFYRAVWQHNWPLCRVLLYRRLYQLTGEVSFSQHHKSAQWQQCVNKVFSDQITSCNVIWLWCRLSKKSEKETQHYQVIPALNSIRVRK